MLNLIGSKKGETVCDPFCGTGTTLLEAESMGIKGIGIDFNEKMCDIAKDNLTANDFKSEILHGDFHKMSEISSKFNGIVTDLPYGQNSKTTKTPKNTLKDFFSNSKKEKICNNVQKRIKRRIEVKWIKKYQIYRHKSLTRTILIK